MPWRACLKEACSALNFSSLFNVKTILLACKRFQSPIQAKCPRILYINFNILKTKNINYDLELCADFVYIKLHSFS